MRMSVALALAGLLASCIAFSADAREVTSVLSGHRVLLQTKQATAQQPATAPAPKPNPVVTTCVNNIKTLSTTKDYSALLAACKSGKNATAACLTVARRLPKQSLVAAVKQCTNAAATARPAVPRAVTAVAKEAGDGTPIVLNVPPVVLLPEPLSSAPTPASDVGTVVSPAPSPTPTAPPCPSGYVQQLVGLDGATFTSGSPLAGPAAKACVSATLINNSPPVSSRSPLPLLAQAFAEAPAGKDADAVVQALGLGAVNVVGQSFSFASIPDLQPTP